MLDLPIQTINLKEGDILLVDMRSVTPNDLARTSASVRGKIWVIGVTPQPGMPLHETIRTCKLEDLEKVVADIKKEVN